MVWLDGEYGLIKWKQQSHFGGKHSDLAFNNPDFNLLAKAFGIWGKVIDGPGQIVAALEEAFEQDGPALIAVPIDYSENNKMTKRLGHLEYSI
jgi:acetolactate synthase-1/2/3 large subunit